MRGRKWGSPSVDGGGLAQEGIFPIQCGTFRGMSILVPIAQIQSHEGTIALGEVAGVDLFGGVVELMSISSALCQ